MRKRRTGIEHTVDKKGKWEGKQERIWIRGRLDRRGGVDRRWG